MEVNRLDSFSIMRRQIINKIMNDYKLGDIIHIDCNWLQRYKINERILVLDELVGMKILQHVYTYRCPECFKNVGYKSKDDLMWECGLCDDCDKLMDEIEAYKNV